MIPALIMAAGSGRRMGGPKALLVFHGETLLQRAVRVAQRDSLPPANDSTPAKGPTWGELLRAPINGATMRAIFTKNLRSA